MACKESCFTFTWKLENASYCLQKKGEFIESPEFVVSSIDKIKRCLGFYPRGREEENYIAFYLCREEQKAGKEEVEFELAFLAEDGSVPKKWPKAKNNFSNYYAYGFEKFVLQEELFNLKRSKFLPQDTLTARCRIWKTDGETIEDVQCFARTRIGIHRTSFLWNVKNFGTLQPKKKCSYHIKSVENDEPLMSIDLSLTGQERSGETIYFELSLQDQAIKFSKLRLSLVDASGSQVVCNEEEFWFDDVKVKKFKFLFNSDQLRVRKDTFLPDDTLSLYWEWTFSKGIVSEEIEGVQYGTTCFESKFSNPEGKSSNAENKFSNPENVNNEKTISLSDTLNDLNSLYDENFLCDVILKTNTRTFNAHKIVLSASSSVFKTMFSSDMKEKYNNCVNIEDLSDDTVSRMLVFIYNARLENLTWEIASHLYTAADKYAILSLKSICSSYLKTNLSPSNACEVLVLSDIHSDEDLKCTVQNYFFKNVKDILNSEGWKLLLESNPKLAAETLALLHK